MNRKKVFALVLLLAQIACQITVQPKGADAIDGTNNPISTISTYRRACEIVTVTQTHVIQIETGKVR